MMSCNCIKTYGLLSICVPFVGVLSIHSCLRRQVIVLPAATEKQSNEHDDRVTSPPTGWTGHEVEFG